MNKIKRLKMSMYNLVTGGYKAKLRELAIKENDGHDVIDMTIPENFLTLDREEMDYIKTYVTGTEHTENKFYIVNIISRLLFDGISRKDDESQIMLRRIRSKVYSL